MEQRTVGTGMPLNSMKLKLKKLKDQVMGPQAELVW